MLKSPGTGKSHITVQVNDTVDYVDLSHPENLLTITIVDNHVEPSNGLINKKAPLAAKLVGKAIGEEFDLHIPTQIPKTFRVINISRS